MPDAAAWFREHATTLTTLDPDEPLDDLEPLRDLVGDARVVALGEGAHFVREFTTARRRLLRFLAERCGFTVLAFEFGFAEGLLLDAWIQGDDADLATLSGTTASGATGELVRWLRAYNDSGAARLRFAGLDLPSAGGRLAPALAPVADYLREADPELLPLVDRVLAIAAPISGPSVAAVAPRWSRLDRAEQDALTASLSRLVQRMRALEPLYVDRTGRQRYDVAMLSLESAWHTDYMFGAMDQILTGGGLAGDTSVRERYQADTLRWQLDRFAGERVVLAAHNNHIQKTPVYFDGELAALPLGHYAARMLGADYRAVAFTHTASTVPEMHPDESAELGFTVSDVDLPEPAPGSVEAGLIAAGHGQASTLTDVRNAPPELVNRMRTQSAEVPLPVSAAYDAVLCVPTTTTDFTTSW